MTTQVLYGETVLLLVPSGAQVLPPRISTLDQGYFLSSEPAFELLFASNGSENMRDDFEVHQLRNVVFAGETWHQFMLVLVDASFQVIGHADIQRSRVISHNVDVELVHARH